MWRSLARYDGRLVQDQVSAIIGYHFYHPVVPEAFVAAGLRLAALEPLHVKRVLALVRVY